jgi:hypothetical protein
MKKSIVFKIINILIIFTCLVGALSYFSYSYSKHNAEKLVGTSLQYFPLSKTVILVAPFHRKYPVWMFTFSNPSEFDAEFEIYVTTFGKIELTNPKDLEQRLRKYETLNEYPYPKGGIVN